MKYIIQSPEYDSLDIAEAKLISMGLRSLGFKVIKVKEDLSINGLNSTKYKALMNKNKAPLKLKNKIRLEDYNGIMKTRNRR